MRKKLILLPFVSLVLAGPGAFGQDAQTPKAKRHEFVITNFKTESGVTLPQARVVYGTYGNLNEAKDNVVLLPSYYMANFHGYEWLIGADKALDPSKLFLVATELLGNGNSSSPSNTPEPYHGPRFPVTTIRDNVEAVHRLLAEELKIMHLRAIIGFSMGAEQAFQWAVSYPRFADRIVATAGTAKCYPHGVVRLEGQIAALTTDPAFANGDYKEQPQKGLEAFSVVWAGWLFSQEWWRRELWREGARPGTTFEQVLNNFRTNFIPGADANNLILQMRTWEKHDVGATPGFGVGAKGRTLTRPTARSTVIDPSPAAHGTDVQNIRSLAERLGAQDQRCVGLGECPIDCARTGESHDKRVLCGGCRNEPGRRSVECAARKVQSIKQE
jgi:homoserine O-acetyltransferase